MGRSSAEQAQHNRARIVAAASRLFRAHGIDAVSIADIMTSLGLTVGGFYKHFPSKEALIAEATALAFDEALTLWRHLLNQPSQSPTAQRRHLVERYLRPDPGRHCPITTLTSPDTPPAARSQYDHGTQALLAQFTNGTPPDRQTLLLFAAMIGARMLGEVAGPAPWVAAVKEAVLAEASTEGGALGHPQGGEPPP